MGRSGAVIEASATGAIAASVTAGRGPSSAILSMRGTIISAPPGPRIATRGGGLGLSDGLRQTT